MPQLPLDTIAAIPDTLSLPTSPVPPAAGSEVAEAIAALADSVGSLAAMSGGEGSGVPFWATIPIALVSIVATYLYQRRTIREKQREDRRKDIYRKLNEFYGPCAILLRESRMWHDLFKKNESFRTLTRLLNAEQYLGNDAVLLEEVMRTTARISELIVDKAGLVEERESETDLVNLLSKARAHYRLLQLAYEKKLSMEADRFAEYVYPQDLDEAIISEKRRLEAERSQLEAE